jgi:hypothetical protein
MKEALAPKAEELSKIREAAGDRELPPEQEMDRRFHRPRRRLGIESLSHQASLFD